MTLVLASTSPRRYQILALLGLPFLMVPPDGSEVGSGERSPAQEALHQARRKAASLAARFSEAILIGSDTLIGLDGRVIGKPRDVNDARGILTRLRGRVHEVVTAVSIRSGTRVSESLLVVPVRMRDYSEAERDAYLATGDSLDKAGAYSVQGLGRSLIERLDGDYLAVMGLPLRAVAQGLTGFGVDVPADVDRLYEERDFLNWRTF